MADPSAEGHEPPERAGRGQDAETPRGPGATGRADASRQVEVARQIEARMRGGLHLAALLILAVIHCGLALPFMLAHLGDHSGAWLDLTAFALLSAVLAADAWRNLRQGPWLRRKARARPGTAGPASRGWTAAMVAVTLAASVAATSRLPAESFMGNAHWSFLEVGWFGVVLLLDRPRTATWLFLGCHLAVTVGQLVHAGLPSRSVIAGMSVSALAICTFQVSTALAVQLLSDRAARASATLRERERWETEAAVAAHMHADQQARYHDLDRSVLPLLAGLADGSVDPREESVRRRCALQATRLRRLFAEHDYAADPLVHELRACIDAAERGGASVHLAVRGDPVELPRPVRQALTEPVLAALVAAEHTARTTVVRGARLVRVSAVIDRADAPPVPDPGHGVRIRTVKDRGRLWVESVYVVEGHAHPAAPRTDRSEFLQ
ncbi:hypothetical protein J2Z21_001121 [Streptomyces griseochromogenes]|uniref:Spidroin-1 n=1 Tax=Streptomyces griseochromogenes TaxID=68214 RepID=A0A1B1AUC0_9ACTN|nr:hypothetical protein [Streptomyces griseochromogenes]ANP50163.1 hypothetical protein AVL59_11550 [Streptomyces griseochromogenes]MBP2048197.1 hypothetical protein [Streptomyces griseochromogenes]